MAKIKFVINEPAPGNFTVTPDKTVVKLQPGDTIFLEESNGKEVFVKLDPANFLGIVNREASPAFIRIVEANGVLHVDYDEPGGGGVETGWPS